MASQEKGKRYSQDSWREGVRESMNILQEAWEGGPFDRKKKSKKGK